jgi:DNA invertase Pin-like site-specific DNA recombinase
MMTQKRRYTKKPAKDLSQTPSGRWLASLTFPTPKAGQIRLIAYLRLSNEKVSESDHLLALQRQYQTCLSLAKKLGGVVVAVRCDMAKSADTRKGARPEFQALLLDLGNYDGLVGSHFFRVVRDPEDITVLIRVYEAHPGLKFSTPQEALDLSTPMGRAAAYGAASRGYDELAVMSQRQSDRHSQLRESGRYVGPRMFGVTGANHDQESPEADLIRKAAKDVLQGKSVAEVKREWDQAGILSPKGGVMARSTIRNMLLSPRIVGYLVHKPKARPGELTPPIYQWTVPDDEGRPIRSQVPAILTEQTWKALITELSGKGDRCRQAVQTRASYVLSQLCWGTVCGEAMNGCFYSDRGRHYYRCAKGCCTISGPHLDSHVGDLLTALWTERAVAVVPEAQPFTQQADLDHWEAQLEEVAQRYRAREMSLSEKLSTLRDINQELAPIQKAWAEWNRSQAAPAPRHTVDQWEQAKAKGDIPAMRRMARAELERLDISKASRKGLKGLQADRVTPVWRQDSAASASGQHPGQGQTESAA